MRILHVTDSHLPFPSPVHSEGDESIFRILEQADATGRYDLIVHTGDVVNRPAPREEYRRYARRIRRLHTPIVHVPGNHDDPVVMAEFFPECANGYPWTYDTEEITVVGLDSADGEVGPAQRERLSELLMGSKPLLVAVHHHLSPLEDSWLNRFRLADAAGLRTLLNRRRAPVVAILHGHIHHSHRYTFAGVPILSGSAASYQFDPFGTFKATTDDGPAATMVSIHAGAVLRCTAVPVSLVPDDTGRPAGQ